MIRSAVRIGISYQPGQKTGQTFGLAIVCLACIVFLGCSENEPAHSVGARSSAEVVNTVNEVPKNTGIKDNAPKDIAPKNKAPEDNASKDGAPSNEVQNKTAENPIHELPVVNDPAFHEGLVNAVESYLQYPMVNAVALEAPADCAAPTDYFQPKMSTSENESTHGRKLYFLFAKDITHYLRQNGTPSSAGQVLVKESWTSKPSNADARNLRNHASGIRINPRTRVGEKIVAIGKRKDLFVMMKLAPETANTDDGWIYGVVDPNTQEITAAGKVAACMQCHEDAKNDRLFGPTLGD